MGVMRCWFPKGNDDQILKRGGCRILVVPVGFEHKTLVGGAQVFPLFSCPAPDRNVVM